MRVTPRIRGRTAHHTCHLWMLQARTRASNTHTMCHRTCRRLPILRNIPPMRHTASAHLILRPVLILRHNCTRQHPRSQTCTYPTLKRPRLLRISSRPSRRWPILRLPASTHPSRSMRKLQVKTKLSLRTQVSIPRLRSHAHERLYHELRDWKVCIL